jgi:UDP-N-acetylglucosamine--N-acetylmuramyl-(pentapeptide) pyrophosphoryl-undecaprenol N-acetylglucosamine transferase
LRNKIIFTGGGSTGHVSVNLALIPDFIEDGWTVEYIGSKNGIEKQLISNINEVKYFSISTGKLRRYFDWNNITDIVKVFTGVFQSYLIIRKSKPNVIFSKGGFVSFPVVLGGWLNRVPVVLHESDVTPGLANKLALPFVTIICTTFPETEKYIHSGKSQYIGSIIRQNLKNGNAIQGLKYCGFVSGKPVLLVMGGSLGSQSINLSIRNNLGKLLKKFQIVHICGKGQKDTSIRVKGYKQFEYIEKELPDVMAISNIVVSRAGANSIFEFLFLQKPMILVPLPQKSSRGDQILNAESFKKRGFCYVIQDKDLCKSDFINTIYDVYENRAKYTENMKKACVTDALNELIKLIKAKSKSK